MGGSSCHPVVFCHISVISILDVGRQVANLILFSVKVLNADTRHTPFMLAYTTGLRGCDIVNLKFDSIDWDACELRLVQEKTNIPVSLPLDTKTGNAIADYILHARPKCKSEYIFLRVLRPYTKIGSMWTVIAKYAHIALGKDQKMNGPHAFRRGMGRQLLEANIPAPLICDILGHSSSVSLRQYTASSLEKLKVCAGTISAIPIAQEALL